MKTLHHPHLWLTVITLLAGLTMPLMAQSDSLPPLPTGWHWNDDGTIVADGGGGFQPEYSGPPGLPGGGGGGSGGSGGGPPIIHMVTPGTNLWLYITNVPASNEIIITLSNTIENLPYILESATNLLGPWYTNQSLLATSTVSVAQPVANDEYQGLYFRALQATPGKLRWAVPLVDISTTTNSDNFGSGLDAAPSLSPDGLTVYMTTPNRTISAIDAATGIVLWTDDIFTPSTNQITPVDSTGSAAVTSSNIYVGSCDGNVYCLNATNGHTNWIHNLGAGTAVYATPAIDPSGRILVPTAQPESISGATTGLTCLVPTATNASVAWFFQPQDLHDPPSDSYTFRGGDIDSSVAVANNGSIYFLAEGWRIYSVDPNGRVNWFLPAAATTFPDSSVAIDSLGRLVVGSHSNYAYCINADGSLEWIFDVYLGVNPADTGPIQCSPTIDAGDNAYMGSGGAGSDDALGNLYSLDATGGTNWVTNAAPPDSIISSPAIGETALYFGSSNCVFFQLTLSNLTLTPIVTNTGPIFSSPLICPDGSVIYGCEDGFLYCYWGASLPAGTNAPWPTFHQNAQRTGLQPGTTTLAENCGAPFPCDATNDGLGHFSFTIVGTTNDTWSVYYSENLSNWTKVPTNITLSGTPASAIIVDDSVLNVPQRYYQLSNATCCSKAIGFTSVSIAAGKMVGETIVPSTNLVADQLCQVDDSLMVDFLSTAYPMNTLNTLFDPYDWATNMGDAEFFKWTGNGFDEQANLGGGQYRPSWTDVNESRGSGDMTLLPGNSVMMVNPTTNSYTIWFTGLIRNQQVFQILQKTNHAPTTNYLSATAPMAGTLPTITGYPGGTNDIVRFWNTNTQSYVSHTNISGSWSNGGLTNILSVGEGFILISTNAETWTNTWGTGVCGEP